MVTSLRCQHVPPLSPIPTPLPSYITGTFSPCNRWHRHGAHRSPSPGMTIGPGLPRPVIKHTVQREVNSLLSDYFPCFALLGKRPRLWHSECLDSKFPINLPLLTFRSQSSLLAETVGGFRRLGYLGYSTNPCSEYTLARHFSIRNSPGGLHSTCKCALGREIPRLQVPEPVLHVCDRRM